MTPETAAALRCPVCGGPLLLTGRSLRCPKAHSFDLAKEGYAYLLPMQKTHCQCKKKKQPTLATARPWCAPAARFCRPGTTPR